MATENQNAEEKWMKHYSRSHQILLVGEGDFSYSLCLARAFGSAHNMVATSLDSKGSLKMKYTNAISNLDELEVLGCSILHEVNTYGMSKHPFLSLKKFDRIVFFPRFERPCDENCKFFIICVLVTLFLGNIREMLTPDGEIHINHITAHPLIESKIVELAKNFDLVLMEEANFDKGDYQNKMGVAVSSIFKYAKP